MSHRPSLTEFTRCLRTRRHWRILPLILILTTSTLVFAVGPARSAFMDLIDTETDGVHGVYELDGAFDVAASADNSYIFVPARDDDSLVLFRRNTDTGALRYVEHVRDGVACIDCLGGARGVTVMGNHIYTASGTSDALAVWALPDLGIAKTNNTSAISSGGAPFTWTVTISNTGDANATFNAGETIFIDNLPPNATYGAPVISVSTGITNSEYISLTLSGNSLSVTANGGEVILENGVGMFKVAFSVTPTVVGDLVNPTGGVCAVDPDNVVLEGDEGNNTCTDTVSVVRGTVTVNVDRTDDTTDQACTSAPNDCSLRGAINLAHADIMRTYTVTLPSGTYSLTGAADDDANLSGDLDILSDLHIQGAGAATTIIDGGGVDRVLHIHSGAQVSIEDVQISGGLAPVEANGGGIYVTGDLDLERCAITQNQAGPGVDEAIPGAIVAGNAGSDAGFGGGLYIASSASVRIASCTLNGNHTGAGGDGGGGEYSYTLAPAGWGGDGGNGGSGGAIYNAGTLDVRNSTLSGNSTGSGGLGGTGGGNFSITPRPGRGGDGGDGGDGGNGGGIVSTGSTSLIFSSITANSLGAGGQGGVGGPGFPPGTDGAYGSTSDGAGVAALADTTQVQNTIVAGNAANDVTGSFTTNGYNLIGNGDSASGFTDGVSSDQVGTAASPSDALLLPLADNGGPTLTHALQNSSPALEQISLSANGCGEVFTADQRGDLRPGTRNSQIDPYCEIGAWEAQLEDPTSLKTDSLHAVGQVWVAMLLAGAVIGLVITRKHT